MKIGNLKDWQSVKTGQVLNFPSDAERRVEFEVLTDGPVAIIASVFDEDGEVHEVPVAQGEGRLAVSYVAGGNSAVRINGAGSRIVSVRGVARSSVVSASAEASFASAMTMGQRKNDEVQRMLYVMKLNEKRREQKMSHTIAEMKAQAAAEAAAKAAEAALAAEVIGEADAATSA